MNRAEIEAAIERNVPFILRMADGEVHILTRRQAIKKAQALVRKHVSGRKSLVRELIRERRGEAANE